MRPLLVGLLLLLLAQAETMDEAKARCLAEGRVFIEKVDTDSGRVIAWWCQ